MKSIVMNFSGNVGKSTVSKHLLFARLPHDSRLFPVESINADPSAQDTIRGKNFSDIMEALPSLDHAVVDVGASNVEDFLARMRQYKGSHEDFDLFLVPTVSTQKQQDDTVSTLRALFELGVPGSRVRLLFNKLEPQTNCSKEFRTLFQLHELQPELFTLAPLLCIQENELYGKLPRTATISSLAQDPTDFSQRIKESKDPQERQRLTHQRALKRLALGVQEELDAVFATLFPEGV